jgi:hypothetical protein
MKILKTAKYEKMALLRLVDPDSDDKVNSNAKRVRCDKCRNEYDTNKSDTCPHCK